MERLKDRACVWDAASMVGRSRDWQVAAREADAACCPRRVEKLMAGAM